MFKVITLSYFWFWKLDPSCFFVARLDVVWCVVLCQWILLDLLDKEKAKDER